MKDTRDTLANGVRKTFTRLSKSQFNEVFNYKLKQRVADPGGATVTNKNNDKILEILKIFLELDKKDIIVNKKFFNTKRRPDYRIDKYKLIFEYDGPDHYRNPFKIYSDKRKFNEYKNRGYRVVRWPYYMQLSKDAAKYIFRDVIKHFSRELGELKKYSKSGFYNDKKFEKAISQVYKNVFTGNSAKKENEVLAHGLHGSNEVASAMSSIGLDNLLKDFNWKTKNLKAPKSIMNEFMYSHKLYIDDICDVENLKFNEEDKKKLILPTAHVEFMNLYNRVIKKIDIKDLKGLFPRNKYSIERTKPN
jgi:hypothetical protein